MRIVDVCPFYTPFGGGVRTYLERKLKAAPERGHEMILLAPGAQASVREVAPGAIIATIPGPEMPLDRRYHYFDDVTALHSALDQWRPDHVEASSPWSSATAVGHWQGSATRSLVMHADPLASYAYRWFERVATVPTIDRWFARFWQHLRGLDNLFDVVITANDRFTRRLRAGGLSKVETLRMGVEPGQFSPARRSEPLRAQWLEELGLPVTACLLLGLGRLAAEKRWPMVIDAVRRVSIDRPVGLLLAGDGPVRPRLLRIAKKLTNVRVIDPISDRDRLATLLASMDALIHGCESETFCMVAAEARASGIPLIVPDEGGAADQVLHGAGRLYRSGSRDALAGALDCFIDDRPRRQRQIAAAAGSGPTMDDHFAALFDRYCALAHSTPMPIAMQAPTALPIAVGC